MTRQRYIQLSIATLAVYTLAVLRPDFVLALTTRFAPAPMPAQFPMIFEPEPVNTATTAIPTSEEIPFRLQDINFDVTPADDEVVEAPTAPVVKQLAPPTAQKQNRLIIPRMGVNAEVIISNSDKTLNKGLWHIPGSALPGQNGNIVISAHRWLHKPPHPATFYSIDTLQVGDPIYYDYQGSRYEYKVTKHFVVNPEDVHILSQDENKLTLFTCTPLYSTKQRYVVNAELIAVQSL